MAKIDGPKLRSHREARGLSQADLAERAGVSEKTVARAEAAGYVQPHTVLLLAGALKVSVADLLAGPPKTGADESPDPTPNVGRITIALDPGTLAELKGPKLEELFRSILTMLRGRFSVELRLANDPDPPPRDQKPTE